MARQERIALTWQPPRAATMDEAWYERIEHGMFWRRKQDERIRTEARSTDDERFPGNTLHSVDLRKTWVEVKHVDFAGQARPLALSDLIAASTASYPRQHGKVNAKVNVAIPRSGHGRHNVYRAFNRTARARYPSEQALDRIAFTNDRSSQWAGWWRLRKRATNGVSGSSKQ